MLINFKRRWQSGQLQRTVNPSTKVYVGSNPTRRTFLEYIFFLSIVSSILAVCVFLVSAQLSYAITSAGFNENIESADLTVTPRDASATLSYAVQTPDDNGEFASCGPPIFNGARPTSYTAGSQLSLKKFHNKVLCFREVPTGGNNRSYAAWGPVTSADLKISTIQPKKISGSDRYTFYPYDNYDYSRTSWSYVYVAETSHCTKEKFQPLSGSKARSFDEYVSGGSGVTIAAFAFSGSSMAGVSVICFKAESSLRNQVVFDYFVVRDNRPTGSPKDKDGEDKTPPIIDIGEALAKAGFEEVPSSDDEDESESESEEANGSKSGSLVPCGNKGQSQCEFDDAVTLVDNILKFAIFYLLLPLAAIGVLATGAKILFFADAPEARQKAINNMWVMLGAIAMAFGAYILVDFMFTLFGVQGIDWRSLI